MSLAAVATIIILFVLSTFLMIWNRGALVIAILIPASDFLGWIDPAIISIKGVFDTFAMVMIFIALALLLSIGRWFDIRHAGFRWPFFLMLLLLLYGLFAPVLRGDSTLSLAVNAAKEFMVILAYPAVFLFLRTEREIQLGWKALTILGAYYCVMELLAQLGGVTFMHATSYFYRPDDFGLWKLYVQYWPVILVFLLTAIYSSVLKGRITWISILLGGAGLFLTFYRSYLIATFVAIPLIAMMSRIKLGRIAVAGTTLGVVVLATLGLVSASSAGEGKGLAAVSDDLVLSSFRELADGSGSSLAGRKRHSSELMKLANAHPLIGYGFVKQEASLIQKLHLATFAGGMLGFVDKGDADVLVKFGYFGGAMLYGSFLWITIAAVVRIRRSTSETESTHLLVVATLAPLFLMVQPVHAPCTYGFALLPMFIAMALVDRESFLLRAHPIGEAYQ
jgi:hypothetical protein